MTLNETMNRVLSSLLFASAACLGLQTLRPALAQTRESDAVKESQMQQINLRMPAAMPIDQDRVSDAGVFVTAGQHVTIYSDIDDEPQRLQWVKLFDAAIEQWCGLFDVDVKTTRPWHMTAIVMQDDQDNSRIRNAGLIPADLPKFPAGYNRGHEFWVYLQKDEYYTRHLILHEGTHAFMQWFLGSSGTPWYSEGMAEWVALHHWDGQSVELKQTITDKAQTPGWGRVKLLRNLVAKKDPKSLDDIFNTRPFAFRDVNSYAWCWAACEFLAHHPLSKEHFAKLPEQLRRSMFRFKTKFRAELHPHWQKLSRDWYLYIHEVGYGTDVAACALKPVTQNDDGSINVLATTSWQSTGITVEPSDRLQITGSGDFIVGETTQPWRCEANGITVEYYAGHPLGKLMAAVISVGPEQIVQVPVGSDSQKSVSFPRGGILALRINESPAKLGDNSGALKVTIEKLE